MSNIKKIIVCIGVFLVLFGVYLILKDNNVFYKNDDVGTNENNKWYYYEKTQKFGTIEKNYVDSNKLVDLMGYFDSYELQFTYPIINISSLDVKRINDELKNLADGIVDEYISSADDYGMVQMNIKSKTIRTDSIFNYSYEFIESGGYLNLLVYKTGVTINGSGFGTISKVYVIDTNTGKELSQSEVMGKYGYNFDSLSIKYKQWLTDGNSEWSYTQDDINEIFDYNYFFYVDENNKLNLIHDSITGDDIVKIRFDGNNILEVVK